MRRQWAVVLACAVALAFPLLFQDNFSNNLAILVLLYAMLGTAWNVLGGFAGQVSLGHAMFFGTGAYTSSWLLAHAHVNPWLGMLAGGAAAIVLSLIVGYPTFRLAGHYFAIATIAVGEIVVAVATNWEPVGGAVGLTLPLQPPSPLNFQFGTGKTGYYYIILALLAAAVLAAWLVQRSRIGFYLAAIREDPEGARSVGINLRSCKLIAIAVSALFTALGGSFYAQYVLFIDPGSVLSLNLSILISLVAILGGVGTLWGPLIGALVLLPLSEFTRVYLANLGGGGRAVNLVIYGFLIMLISAYQPNGLVGLFKRRRKRSGLDQGSLADQRPPEGALV